MNTLSAQALNIGSNLLTTSGTSGIYLNGSNNCFCYSVITETGNTRILTPTDAQSWIRFTNNSPTTGILAPDVSGIWPVNTEIAFEQAGSGQLTLTIGTGVILNTSSSLTTNTQYSVIGIKRVGINLWTCFGDRT